MDKTQQTQRPSPTALLNPRSDPAFKGIFTQGTAQTDLALKSFLTAMIGRKIKEVALQPNEPAVDSTFQKQMRFDVSVTFDNGELADIEMQERREDYDYDFRSEGQVARLLNSTIKKGEKWIAKKVYQISVLNFEYDKDDNNVMSCYTMRNSKGKSLGDLLNVIYLDLTKAKRLLGKPADELKAFEKWALFFAYEADEKVAEYLRRIIESEEGLMAAHNTVETMSNNDYNWLQQLHYENAILDYNTAMYCSREKGIAEGEQKKAVEAARSFLKEGDSPEKIARCIGLPLETVKELAKEITKNGSDVSLVYKAK